MSYHAIFGDNYPNINMARRNLTEVLEALALANPQKLGESGSDAGYSGGYESTLYWARTPKSASQHISW